MGHIKDILQHANSYGSRSSILSVLVWIFGTLLTALTVSSIFKAPIWVSCFLAILIGIAFFVMIGAYIFCLYKDKPDLLRSESFNLQKLAIERQTSSDSLVGIQTPNNKIVDAQVVELIDEEEQ